MKLVAHGLDSPVLLVSPPGDRRQFIVDQVGVIWIQAGGQMLPEPFLDIRARLVDLSAVYDERGLLGLAFPPDFARSGRFYVYYSAPLTAGQSPDVWDHTTHISEFTVLSAEPDRADPSSERVLLAVDKPGYNYEAGHLAFGPDGYLYIAMGDSARFPDREIGGYAQDPYSLLGKILRLQVTAEGFRIPPDNPFASGGGRPEVYALGLRNPYRFSFDAKGEFGLVAADVGHALMEEINQILPAGNYGWPIREGTTCFNLEDWIAPLGSCAEMDVDGRAFLDPVIAYWHAGNLSAVIGGAFYRGNELPELRGRYIFGDWGRGEGRLFAAQPAQGGPWQYQEIVIETGDGAAGIGQLLGIGEDAGHELYLLVKQTKAGPGGGGGQVYQIVPP
ncbi:MAG TPA: PQQ-dependent sugar dehydrogenase [Anaerolineales bacterium]|nr:PQQ-dependent sugar dehydrogenase [Anaerolineales bacterium]